MFIHFVLWGGMQIFRSEPSPIPAPTVEFVVIDQEEADRLLEKDNEQKQIVEQSKQRLNDEIPEKTKFLSRHNQRVEEETRAAKTGKFTNAAVAGAPPSGSQQAEKTEKPKEKPEKSLQNGQLPTLAALKPDFRPTPPGPTRPPTNQPPGTPSQSDDHLKDTKLGIQTLLNTREFVYYSYYTRIKEKIRQHWEPSIRANVKRVVQQGRTIASARDRRTRVLITLDKNGTLLQIKVIGQSGIMELDDAAIDAFKAAAPFPNPPKGMVEGDGNIRIRWDFILEA